MSDIEPNIATTTDMEPEPSSVQRTELRAEEALERLKRGEIHENLRINRLQLRGEFEKPVRLRNCALIRLEVEKAVFKSEVLLANCTLDRAMFRGQNVFELSFVTFHSAIRMPVGN
jgi:hypothetical protein